MSKTTQSLCCVLSSTKVPGEAAADRKRQLQKGVHSTAPQQAPLFIYATNSILHTWALQSPEDTKPYVLDTTVGPAFCGLDT